MKPVTSYRIKIPIAVLWLVLAGCGSTAASFQQSALVGFDTDAFLLPTDVAFEPSLSSPGLRQPSSSDSSGVALKDALTDNTVLIDGYSPLSELYVPMGCEAREDLIPEKDFDSLFLYDLSFRRRVPVHVRYRNHRHCGLLIRPKQPLAFDRLYAIVILDSYVWMNQFEKSNRLSGFLTDLIRFRDDRPELSERGLRFGLRPRETRLAVDLLREQGVSVSRILRLGILATRSRGGLYGPFLAIQQHYLLHEEATIRSVTAVEPNVYRFTIRLSDPCLSLPCRLAPVFGPTYTDTTGSSKYNTTDRHVLVRFSMNQSAKTMAWVDAAEPTAQRNETLFRLQMFHDLSNEANIHLAMTLRPIQSPNHSNDRMAAILEQSAISKLLQSYGTAELTDCAKKNQCADISRSDARPKNTNRLWIQYCLSDSDCAATGAFDPYVSHVVFPLQDYGLQRPAFVDGQLPTKKRIMLEYTRELKNDFFSLHLIHQQLAGEGGPLQKKFTVLGGPFTKQSVQQFAAFIRKIEQHQK